MQSPLFKPRTEWVQPNEFPDLTNTSPHEVDSNKLQEINLITNTIFMIFIYDFYEIYN